MLQKPDFLQTYEMQSAVNPATGQPYKFHQQKITKKQAQLTQQRTGRTQEQIQQEIMQQRPDVTPEAAMKEAQQSVRNVAEQEEDRLIPVNPVQARINMGQAPAEAFAKSVGTAAAGAITGVPQATGEVVDFFARLAELGMQPIDTVKALSKGDLSALPERGMITSGTRKFAEALTQVSDFLQESVGLSPDDAAVQLGEFLSPTLGQVAAVSKVATKGSKAAQKASQSLESRLRSSAESGLESVLAPTKTSAKVQTQRILPQLAEEAPIAKSRESLLQFADKQAKKFGEQIDAFIESNQLTGKIKRDDLLQILKDKKDDFIVAGVEANPQAVRAIDEISSTLSQFSDEIEPKDAIQLRRVWDKMVQSSGGFQKDLKDTQMLKFIKDMSNEIRSTLAKENPNLADLNKQFSLWATARNVLGDTIKRKTGQSGIVQKGGQVLFGALAGQQGGVEGALLGAGIARGLGSLLDSTAWKTVSAATKTKLANSLAEGRSEDASKIIESLLRKYAVTRAATATAPIRSEQ